MATFNRSYFSVFVRCIDLLFAGWIWRDYGITISSFTRLEMRKVSAKRWARVLNGFLNLFEKEHCEKARLADIERAETAIKILKGEQAP